MTSARATTAAGAAGASTVAAAGAGIAGSGVAVGTALTTTGAAMSSALAAGMSSLASEAAVSLPNNGGDIGKTLQDRRLDAGGFQSDWVAGLHQNDRRFCTGIRIPGHAAAFRRPFRADLPRGFQQRHRPDRTRAAHDACLSSSDPAHRPNPIMATRAGGEAAGACRCTKRRSARAWICYTFRFGSVGA